ncbi:hypothetical protein NE237_006971 [Protea cynaroides]|uniref:Uncharacterized protein n=1 Tax=Protea cynaroides TaxID=273540 RepID=A0A9Q0QVY7_9MAGN|nr:hypothetical protein NE237_006971 [Protea cynaroides]
MFDFCRQSYTDFLCRWVIHPSSSSSKTEKVETSRSVASLVKALAMEVTKEVNSDSLVKEISSPDLDYWIETSTRQKLASSTPLNSRNSTDGLPEKQPFPRVKKWGGDEMGFAGTHKGRGLGLGLCRQGSGDGGGSELQKLARKKRRGK